jgi:hypothetical protein
MPAASFSAGVTLRKVHAVIVVPTTKSGCSVGTAVALSHLFAQNRDSVAVIGFNAASHILLPLTTDFETAVAGMAKNPQCSGRNLNIAAGLEAAYQELADHQEPDTLDVVIQYGMYSNAFTASFSVNKRPDGTVCKDASEGQLPATLVADYAGRPGERIGPLITPASGQFDDYVAFARAGYPGVDKASSCYDLGLGSPNGTFSSLPERDANGVSLSGRHPLERFDSSPRAGEIRLYVQSNVANAIANLTENAAAQLRSGPHPAVVYSLLCCRPPEGLSSPLEIRVAEPWDADGPLRLANDRRSKSFDPKQPAGLGYDVNILGAIIALDEIGRYIAAKARVPAP